MNEEAEYITGEPEAPKLPPLADELLAWAMVELVPAVEALLSNDTFDWALRCYLQLFRRKGERSLQWTQRIIGHRLDEVGMLGTPQPFDADCGKGLTFRCPPAGTTWSDWRDALQQTSDIQYAFDHGAPVETTAPEVRTPTIPAETPNGSKAASRKTLLGGTSPQKPSSQLTLAAGVSRVGAQA